MPPSIQQDGWMIWHKSKKDALDYSTTMIFPPLKDQKANLISTEIGYLSPHSK